MNHLIENCKDSKLDTIIGCVKFNKKKHSFAG